MKFRSHTIVQILKQNLWGNAPDEVVRLASNRKYGHFAAPAMKMLRPFDCKNLELYLVLLYICLANMHGAIYTWCLQLRSQVHCQALWRLVVMWWQLGTIRDLHESYLDLFVQKTWDLPYEAQGMVGWKIWRNCCWHDHQWQTWAAEEPKAKWSKLGDVWSQYPQGTWCKSWRVFIIDSLDFPIWIICNFWFIYYLVFIYIYIYLIGIHVKIKVLGQFPNHQGLWPFSGLWWPVFRRGRKQRSGEWRQNNWNVVRAANQGTDVAHLQFAFASKKHGNLKTCTYINWAMVPVTNSN